MISLKSNYGGIFKISEELKTEEFQFLKDVPKGVYAIINSYTGEPELFEPFEASLDAQIASFAIKVLRAFDFGCITNLYEYYQTQLFNESLLNDDVEGAALALTLGASKRYTSEVFLELVKQGKYRAVDFLFHLHKTEMVEIFNNISLLYNVNGTKAAFAFRDVNLLYTKKVFITALQKALEDKILYQQLVAVFLKHDPFSSRQRYQTRFYRRIRLAPFENANNLHSARITYDTHLVDFYTPYFYPSTHPYGYNFCCAHAWDYDAENMVLVAQNQIKYESEMRYYVINHLIYNLAFLSKDEEVLKIFEDHGWTLEESQPNFQYQDIEILKRHLFEMTITNHSPIDLY